MINSLDVASPTPVVAEHEPDIWNHAINPAPASHATRSASIGIPSVPVLLLALLTALPSAAGSVTVRKSFLPVED